ncbi:MAG: S-methyl-5-thioribose-1-phosphate isomerase [Nannocystaceae bacterium]
MTVMGKQGIRHFEASADGTAIRLLDQRALPSTQVWLQLRGVEAVAKAIEDLAVRGAPAIGCVAALGLATAAQDFSADPATFRTQVNDALIRLAATRPTAVNLFVALDEIKRALARTAENADTASLRALLRQTADAHIHADKMACETLSRNGAGRLPDAGGVLTHCNAGALATAGMGTALGVIRAARGMGKRFTVFAGETRPMLQGARLTAWELEQDNVPVEVITDNMAGALMAQGVIHAAIVGADRIARNGDVANKIGTYTVAVLCRYHKLPFYVAAPWTTVDLQLRGGQEIPIEDRHPDEVHYHGASRKTPENVGVRNPAFDITPANLITAIITDRGVCRPDELAEHHEHHEHHEA